MPSYDGVEANSFSSVRPREAPIGIWQHPSSRANPLLVRNVTGDIVGGIPSPGSLGVQAVVDSYTIQVGTIQQHYLLVPCTTGGAKTGVIMAPGLYDGQVVIVINRDTTKGNTIGFDSTPATCRIAQANDVFISGGTGLMMVWDAQATTPAWYITRHAAVEP